MIIEALKAILEEDGDVAAIVGDRIYPRQLPDAVTFPALVLTKVGGPGTYDLQGDANLENARVQVDCYSEDGYSAVLVLKKAVRRRLSGFRGGQEGVPCQIDSVFCINDTDESAPERERAGPRLRRRMLEFTIWNREL